MTIAASRQQWVRHYRLPWSWTQSRGPVCDSTATGDTSAARAWRAGSDWRRRPSRAWSRRSGHEGGTRCRGWGSKRRSGDQSFMRYNVLCVYMHANTHAHTNIKVCVSVCVCSSLRAKLRWSRLVYFVFSKLLRTVCFNNSVWETELFFFTSFSPLFTFFFLFPLALLLFKFI